MALRPEIKVGDRVRMKQTCVHEWPRGLLGTVVKVTSSVDTIVHVEVDGMRLYKAYITNVQLATEEDEQAAKLKARIEAMS